MEFQDEESQTGGVGCEDVNMTIPELVREIMERKDFVEFSWSLERQLLDIANKKSRKLFFQIDVSGGCRQMMQMVWIALDDKEVS